MTSSPTSCADCAQPVPLQWTRCPHCGRPSLFPNVRAADDPTERSELDNSYASARANATARGSDTAVRDLEQAASRSSAVISRSFDVAMTLVQDDRNLYATYYQLLSVRLPEGFEWD